MKKIIFILAIISFLILFSGCTGNDQYMDLPAEDGNFYYSNKDLGFNLVLPPEFNYYQTQRKLTNNYIDLEFFVPTSDKDYLQEVQGYAKPIVVRVFEKDKWEEMKDSGIYQFIGGNKSNVYSIRFWEETPVDWSEKWSEEMKKNIIDNFEIK
ncbi:MAG: hypothetical protein ABIE43_03040 [Patescibacteria group bacterium]